MSRSVPDLDWEKSPEHLAFLRTFLEPRPARDPSSAVDWQQGLGEEPEQAVRRLLMAGALVHDYPGPHLARRFTVPQLRDALRERGLLVGGRKEELIARLLEADADGMRETVADVVLLRCSDHGRQVLQRYHEQEAEAAARQEIAPREEEGVSTVGQEPLPGQVVAEHEGRPRHPDLNAGAKAARESAKALAITVWLWLRRTAEALVRRVRELELRARARAAWAWATALVIRVWSWLRRAGEALSRRLHELELGARARAAWQWVKSSASRAWQWLQRTVLSLAGRTGTAEAQTVSERRLRVPLAPTGSEASRVGLQGPTIEVGQAGAPLAPEGVQLDAARRDMEWRLAPEAAGRGPDGVALADTQGQQNARDWIVRGDRGLANGEYQQAVDDFGRAIDVDPRLASAYGGRGFAFTRLGDWQRAIADYDRAIELEPQYAGTYHDRGVAYERMGDYQRALDNYGQAVELDPQLAGAHCGRGTAYRWLNDPQRALESYGRAIELEPRLANAHSGCGDVYYVLGDYARAIAEYDRAIKIDGKYADAYHNRGLAHERLGDYRRAAADYRMVRELTRDPDLRKWVEERLQEVLGKLW